MPLYLNGVEKVESPVETIFYTGDGNASQSVTGLGFQARMIDITLEGTPVKSVYTGRTSKMYDTTTENYRNTNDGEHLTIDTDGFTIEKEGDGNELNIPYVARCYR